MPVTYAPLWRTMKGKGVSQYHLIHHCGVSSGQLYRLHKDEYVSTHTIELLCNILDCNVQDVMDITD